MKYLMYIVNTLFIVLMLAVAGLFMLPLLPIDNGLELKIVESGSMEPAIMTGSLVAIWPSQNYEVGEVITFKDASARVPTTHRIVDTYNESGHTWFITKGDANEEADTQAVAARDIIGSVKVAVPYAGFILDFARQPLGFTFLILLPALMLIMSEVEKIWKELKKSRQTSVVTTKEKRATTEKRPVPLKLESQPTLPPVSVTTDHPMMDIATPIRFRILPTLDLRGVVPYPRYSSEVPTSKTNRWLAIVFAGLFCTAVVGSSFLGSTVSYFNDIESSVQNALQAITLDFSVIPDGAQYSFEDGELVADDDGAVVTVVTPEPGSVELRHDVSVEIKGGNVLFCDAIAVSSNVPVAYAGALSSLGASDVLFDTPWSLALSLPDSVGFFNGEMCVVDIVFTAWHYDVETDRGYFDEERAPLSFELISPIAAPLQLLVTAPERATGTPSTTSETKASSTLIVPEVVENTEEDKIASSTVVVEKKEIETETEEEPEAEEIEEVKEPELEAEEEPEAEKEVEAMPEAAAETANEEV